ncbi:UPF0102 protein yraN [Desulfotomaculum nigrificans CO-1-SRB]|uniref:UPF0102 protein Desca_1121 n=1 Tax=Desulfotomaculum nigrificans (strain DSM 14880 / VKM B-2319 / CO-1-SRB) TaxID=868595 RepID=F6B3G2_DESCC|nr:YraN family protein [Desulfotomaculum nigrificans]AEF93991.1 UPF0102 protein yraN [Desulfotomaculum nigrificans CO-1-SRB]
MGLDKKKLGNRAEDEATRYLIKLGWQIIERNYRCRLGELDIIARDERGTLVFVEVRSRSGVTHGSPEESVDYRKQKKLRMLGQQYLLARPQYINRPCRFDVLAITYHNNGGLASIKHIRNAL